MTPLLGKRKRKEEKPTRRVKEASPVLEDESAIADAQEIFRRHFEAQFKPLPEVKKTAKSVRNEELSGEEDEDDEDDEDDDEEGDEDDWEGLSGPDDDANIEVIEHTSSIPKTLMSKEEMKRFMSSKPPTDPSQPQPPLSKSKPSTSDDSAEHDNLKNDLALQRLLTESHLLDSASATGPTGSNRHKATDMRLLSLGAKTSILTQKSLPMSHRKGITKKATDRKEQRRKTAKENGIILEIAKGGGKRSEGSVKDAGRREKSVGGATVGRFKGGTLTLSKNDIKEIEGPKRGSSGGRGGRGGGRGGRGGKKRGKR